MKTSNLRTNQLPNEDYAWYLAYLKTMDARDIGGYGKYVAENCELIFNNEEPTRGRSAILERLGGYWQSFASIEHDLLNVYGNTNCFMLEALNHYKRHDGKAVTCRAVALTDRDAEGLVMSVRLYTDVSSLFA